MDTFRVQYSLPIDGPDHRPTAAYAYVSAPTLREAIKTVEEIIQENQGALDKCGFKLIRIEHKALPHFLEIVRKMKRATEKAPEGENPLPFIYG